MLSSRPLFFNAGVLVETIRYSVWLHAVAGYLIFSFVDKPGKFIALVLQISRFKWVLLCRMKHFFTFYKRFLNMSEIRNDRQQYYDILLASMIFS
jgi:hypothetical protein